MTKKKLGTVILALIALVGAVGLGVRLINRPVFAAVTNMLSRNGNLQTASNIVPVGSVANIMPFENYKTWKVSKVQNPADKILPALGGIGSEQGAHQFVSDFDGDGHSDILSSFFYDNNGTRDVRATIFINDVNGGYWQFYKCVIRQESSKVYYYYGDCASDDQSNPGPNVTPKIFFYDDYLTWKHSKSYNQLDKIVTGLNVSAVKVNTTAAGRFVDFNGDVLDDLVYADWVTISALNLRRFAVFSNNGQKNYTLSYKCVISRNMDTNQTDYYGDCAANDPNDTSAMDSSGLWFFSNYQTWPQSTSFNPSDKVLSGLLALGNNNSPANFLDYNEDGLSDIVYIHSTLGGGEPMVNTGIFLNNSNLGYTLSYKCAIRSKIMIDSYGSTYYEYTYYGNCASNSLK